MPLNLAKGAELVGNQTFQYRVAMAFYFVARQVLVESPATPGHDLRVNCAMTIITRDYTQFMQYAALIATDDAIVSGGPYPDPAIAPADGLLITAVSAMWNRLAGVSGA